MKTRTLFLASLCLMSVSAMVQTTTRYKNVTLQDGTVSQYAVSDVKEGKFATKKNINFNGHENDYVDLGLPSGLLWAKMNIGATSPEDYGDYFAWGETTPHKDSNGDYTSYSWSSEGDYKWGVYDSGDSPNYGMTKYNNADGKTTLEPEDDAATANWGGDWRMPTMDELAELRDEHNCTWKWTTMNGKNGHKVITKKDLNNDGVVDESDGFIFLPAAGYRWDSGLIVDGSNGNYWSSSLYSDHPNNAQFLFFYYSSKRDWYSNCRGRSAGQSVRPVCPAPQK